MGACAISRPDWATSECFHVAFRLLFGSLGLAEMAGLPEDSLRGHQSLLRQAPGWSQRQLLVLIVFDIFFDISGKAVAGCECGPGTFESKRGAKKGSACRKPNKINALLKNHVSMMSIDLESYCRVLDF